MLFMSVLALGALGCSRGRDSEADRITVPEMSWETQHSVVAQAPLETVWAFHSDVDNWVRLEGDAVEAITLDGPFQAGTRGTTKLPNQAPTHWRLVEVEPPRRTVIEMDLPEAVLRVTWTFDTLPDGKTRMAQRMTLAGPGAEAMAPVMEAAFSKNMEAGMARMAEVIASDAADQ